MKSKSSSTKPIDLNQYKYTQSISQSISTTKKKNNPSIKANSQETFLKILKWRSQNEAPVDVVGCQILADKQAPIQVQKYQTLIALMLSVQTKDQITGMVMGRLKQYGLTPQKMSKISEGKLIQFIRESNFNKRKAKNIIEVSERIIKNGIAKTKEQLLQYPGVGIKISMLYLRVAEGQNDGIGVDTHVHRITNRLGWINTKTPNESQQSLQKVFPKKLWADINLCLVGFGQIMCEAKKPKCSKCPVAKQCPSYRQLF